jgi:hypothetical protein
VFRPADAGRNEASTAAAGEAGQGSAGAAGGIARRGNGRDGDAESLAGFRQPLAPVAEIPQRRTLEASVGELAQNRDNGFRVMPICRRNIDPQARGKPYLSTAAWILTPLIFFPPSFVWLSCYRRLNTIFERTDGDEGDLDEGDEMFLADNMVARLGVGDQLPAVAV